MPRSWNGRLNILRMSILPKLIYRLNTISVKTPVGLFVNKERMILKFIWTGKGIVKSVWGKKNKVGKLTLIKTHFYIKTCI